MVQLNEEVTDAQVWGGDASGVFSVKYAYECLANHGSNPHNNIFKQLWQAKAFPNVLTTAWTLWDRLPTITSLFRRGVVTPLLCVMFHASDESSQHLFVDCSIAQRVWALCFR